MRKGKKFRESVDKAWLIFPLVSLHVLHTFGVFRLSSSNQKHKLNGPNSRNNKNTGMCVCVSE